MELHNYQKRIISHIDAHPRCILSVDMGLGKTAAVLHWLAKEMPETAVIIAPKRVAENNWLQEAEKWGLVQLASRMTIVAGMPIKRASALADDAHPYKIISRDNVKDVEGYTFDVVVLDELTSFKTPTSKRTKAVCNVHAKRARIGLTGTFLANGAIDIFGQAAACGLGWWKLNFYAWRAMYFRDVLAGAGLQFQKWKLQVPLRELLEPIKDAIFTLTADDYLEIPAVTHTTHAIALDAATRNSIAELDAFLCASIGGQTFTINEQQKFAKLQTLANGFVYDEDGKPMRSAESSKLNAVADFVAECKDAGESVLLFYAYREEAIWLAELLKARGIKYESVQAKGFMERWNAGETECLFAHPASAGHGLNLQHGGRVIVWSTLTYNYELFAQGNARLARQGQKHNVQTHYFIAADTCEERIVKSLQSKQDEQTEFLNLTKQ